MKLKLTKKKPQEGMPPLLFSYRPVLDNTAYSDAKVPKLQNNYSPAATISFHLSAVLQCNRFEAIISTFLKGKLVILPNSGEARTDMKYCNGIESIPGPGFGFDVMINKRSILII